MRRPFLGILGSGKGSNFEAIYHAVQQNQLKAEIKLVISDIAEAGILQKAKQFQVPHFFINREKFETETIALLKQHQVDLVILAGFMRVLSADFVNTFPNHILNIHPSLLPKFRGKKAWEQVWQSDEKETGCTVHIVTKELDSGPILAQRRVAILPQDNAEILYERIRQQEHQLYPKTIQFYWEKINYSH
ncbi:MAG: phosphoribosylglycinamide formyltransferase [Verrucomicrobiae bacterium]|nr:phosphoribosylglycinamide formyltransferase [Verrucomicrobiae bacterium]